MCILVVYPADQVPAIWDRPSLHMTTSRLLALVVGRHLVSDRLEIDPRAPLVVDHNPVHSRQDVEVLRAAHRLSAHRFLDRKVGGPPLSLPAPDVPSAVVLGHPAPRSVRFGNGQGVLAAFGEHRAVLADALGVRFAPRPVPTTLPLWREEQRRLAVPARPQEAPISTITVDGQSGRIFTAGSRHSARRTSGYTSHRIGLTHLTHGYLRTCHRGNPFHKQHPSQSVRTVSPRSGAQPEPSTSDGDHSLDQAAAAVPARRRRDARPVPDRSLRCPSRNRF